MTAPPPDLVAALRAFSAQVLQEGGRLVPPLALGPRQRRALGGHVFEEAPFLVECVAEALDCPGADFRHLPVGAEALRRQQDEASAWKQLSAALGALAQLAADHYLVQQAGAAQLARLVAQTVEEEGAAPLPEHERLPHLLRRRALGAALSLVEDRRRRIERRARQVRKARGLPPVRRRPARPPRAETRARLRDLAAAAQPEEP